MNLTSNAKWNSFSQLFKIAVQLLNIIYLTKLVLPSEYGILAIAMVFTNFGILLRDLGTNAALIQRKNLTNNLINTVFWLNVIMGISLAVIICIISPLIAGFYHQPKLQNVLLFLSLVFPLSSFASAHLALLERKSFFKKIAFIEILSSIISVTVAIYMATRGFGVYSLVSQSVLLSLISCVLFWIVSDWRPSFRKIIHINELKEIFGFSVNLSSFNFVNYFSRNADSFLIGKFMSVVILGNYNLAYRIMLFPLQSLTFVTSRSLLPVLSHYQDDNKKIQSTYLNCMVFILSLSAPLMSGVAIYSHQIINLIFDSKWSLAADILIWLAPTAIIQSILSTTGSILTAKNETNLMMRLGLFGAFLQVGSFLIGVHFSIIIFSFLYFLSNILNFIVTMNYTLKVVSLTWGQLINKLLPVVISTLIMIFSLIFINGLNFSIVTGFSLSSLIFISIIGAGLYFISLFFLSADFRMFISKFKANP